MQFNVSVIIPVFNAAPYLEKAINSALSQKEVNEIIIIDDGSTDGSLEIILKCQNDDNRIKLFQHPKKDNKGRSASRNLGISMATSNYIAFLDADDYYLPGRFNNDKLVFKENKEAGGVYNAMGVEFYREYCLDEMARLKLVTMNKIFLPNELFLTLLEGKFGHFSLNGLTMNRFSIPQGLIFNQSLEVYEDTNYILKLSLSVNLIAGNIYEPRVIRGVHNNNVFDNQKLYKKNISISTEDVLRYLFFVKKKSVVNYRVLNMLIQNINLGTTWKKKLNKAFELIKFSGFDYRVLVIIFSKAIQIGKLKILH